VLESEKEAYARALYSRRLNFKREKEKQIEIKIKNILKGIII